MSHRRPRPYSQRMQRLSKAAEEHLCVRDENSKFEIASRLSGCFGVGAAVEQTIREDTNPATDQRNLRDAASALKEASSALSSVGHPGSWALRPVLHAALEGLFAPGQLDHLDFSKSGESRKRLINFVDQLAVELEQAAGRVDLDAPGFVAAIGGDKRPGGYRKSRVPKEAAKMVAQEAAAIYEAFTGQPATRRNRDVGIQQEPYGPYIAFLTDVLAAFPLNASPDEMAKQRPRRR